MPVDVKKAAIIGHFTVFAMEAAKKQA